MFELSAIGNLDKPEFYRELGRQLESLLHGERDPIANAANTAALLFHSLPDVNWAGFYFLRENGELVVGPFQGKPACVRIPAGRGVCGEAAARGQSILVDDVNAFSGHIACDPVSRSELVVPLISNGDILGVLDIDSPLRARFEEHDREGIERATAIYIRATYG